RNNSSIDIRYTISGEDQYSIESAGISDSYDRGDGQGSWGYIELKFWVDAGVGHYTLTDLANGGTLGNQFVEWDDHSDAGLRIDDAYLGYSAWGDEPGCGDDLNVRKYCATEPSFSSAGAEETTTGLVVNYVTAVMPVVSILTDYSAGFTPGTSEGTDVGFDFSAFGDMDLSTCSDVIGNYTFTGFSTNPTGVTIDNTNKFITFTGGAVVAGVAHTIVNASPGTGWRITNTATSQTQAVIVRTSSSSDFYILTIHSPPSPPDTLYTHRTETGAQSGDANPSGVILSPWFSALYQDPDNNDTADYYQIQVGTTEGGSDMWDSGQTSMTTTTESYRCPSLQYTGSALDWGTTYW
ncbi:unnamed protein product, partial [marine sediment metagenome]